MRNHVATLAIGIFLAAQGFAAAQGLIIPTEPDLPPLALTGHTVKVEIDQQTATTTIEQIFLNNTERALEAQYVFPVPKGAAMTRFTMLVDGKEKAGELVEKDAARRIYNSIVSRSLDPGLLEYLGGELFRANIFPIAPHGTQKITLRYSQLLAAENGLVGYTYPVRASGRRGAVVHGRLSIEVDLNAPAPIRTLYSPTHPVTVTRNGDMKAKASFAATSALLDRDFQLFYGVSAQDIGLHLVTHRPDPAKPGYFMLLAAPDANPKDGKIVERDVIFVVDVSGSMAGAKIQQARGALKHCLSAMNDGDRFNIIPFSSGADPWRRELVSAREHRAAGIAFAETLLAQGGTNIAGALDAALAFPRVVSRPTFIIFMTDGKPTVGITDPREILKQATGAVSAADGKSVRIFTWGVGYDVDTQLLDGVAESAGGVSEYVRPEEDIEAKVSSFYAKASRPVLTNLDLQVEGDKVQLVNLLPGRLPDLYAGTQLVLFGRYTGSGDIALKLTGRVNDEIKTFGYEGSFAAAEKRHDFIEPLWARRRIGALLDQIRLHGETKELVDDVIRLSLDYGIQTPYTSYLILEDGTPVTTTKGGAPEPAGPGEGRGRRELSKDDKKALDGLSGGARPSASPSPAGDPGTEEEKARANKLDRDLQEGFKESGGKAAVETADHIQKLKQSEQAAGRGGSSRSASGTRFFPFRGMWVDDRYQADQATVSVKFGSEAYFRILELRPELVEAFKLGTAVIYVTPAGQALVIGAAGEEKMEDAKIEAMFVKK